MTQRLRLPRGTAELLQGEVVANVILDTETIDLSLTRNGIHTWLPATWIGNAGTTRTARTNSVVDLTGYPEELYSLYARVGASPEAPIIYLCGVFIYTP